MKHGQWVLLIFLLLLASSALALDYTVSVSSDENVRQDSLIPENDVIPFYFTVQNGSEELLNIVQVTVQFPKNYYGRIAEAPNGWATQGNSPWGLANDLNFVALSDANYLVSGTNQTFSVSVSVPAVDAKSVSFSSSDYNVGRSAVVLIRLFPTSTPQTPESQLDDDGDGLSNYQETLDKTNPNDAQSNAYRLILENDSVPLNRAIRLFLYHPTIGKIVDSNAEFHSPSGRTLLVSPNADGTIVFSPSEEGVYQITVYKKLAKKSSSFNVYGEEVIPGGSVGKTGTGNDPKGLDLPIDFAVLVAISLFVEVFGFTLSKVFFSVPENRLQRVRQLLIRTAFAILLFSVPVGIGFASGVGFQNAVGIALIELVVLFIAVYYKTKISGFHIMYLFSKMLFKEKTMHPTMESVAEQRIELEIAREERNQPLENEKDALLKEIMGQLQQSMGESGATNKKITEQNPIRSDEPVWVPEASIGMEKKSQSGARYFESKRAQSGKSNVLVSFRNELGAPLSASKAMALLDEKPFKSTASENASTISFKLEKNALAEFSIPGYVTFREKMVPFKNGLLEWTIEFQSTLQLQVSDNQGNALNQAFISIQGDAELRVTDSDGNFIWQTIQGKAFIPLESKSIKSKKLTIKCIQAHFDEGSESFSRESINPEKQLKKKISMKRIG